MENEKFMKGYLIITDHVRSDGESDVSDAIQKVIDDNPNRVIFFPDGVYALSKPILTPAHPRKSVCLQLSAYAKIRPIKDYWDSGEVLIRLGAKDAANIITEAGSNYYLEGGIIDCEGRAKGFILEKTSPC